MVFAQDNPKRTHLFNIKISNIIDRSSSNFSLGKNLLSGILERSIEGRKKKKMKMDNPVRTGGEK